MGFVCFFVCVCSVFFQNPANEGFFKEIFPETIKKGKKYQKKKEKKKGTQGCGVFKKQLHYPEPVSGK